MIALKPPSTNSPSPDPDAALMMRVRHGDRDAFEALVARYYDRVLFVVQHLMGHGRECEDLAQDVFLRVYRARERYEPQSKFSTWLFVIVNNVVRNARRTLARRHEVQMPAEVPRYVLPTHRVEDRSDTPERAAIRSEVRAQVRGSLARLNGRQKRAVELYHFRGMSYAEIAAEMKTTLCAAKALLHRARVALREHFEQQPV